MAGDVKVEIFIVVFVLSGPLDEVYVDDTGGEGALHLFSL